MKTAILVTAFLAWGLAAHPRAVAQQASEAKAGSAQQAPAAESPRSGQAGAEPGANATDPEKLAAPVEAKLGNT